MPYALTKPICVAGGHTGLPRQLIELPFSDFNNGYSLDMSLQGISHTLTRVARRSAATAG
jgi:hypothetical protein